MKNRIQKILILGVTAALCASAFAAAVKTGYITHTAPLPLVNTSGISVPGTTNTAEVFFPSEPVSTIRITEWEALADTNTTILTWYAGTQPYTILGIANATNLIVATNISIPTNSVCIIQGADDSIISVTVNMTNQLTNVVIAATNAAWTIATNSTLWVCTNVMVIPLGGSNNIIPVRATGEALFSAQRRAPVMGRVTVSGVNGNRLSATAKYDILP